jgi:gluconate 5-dehydrogenase
MLGPSTARRVALFAGSAAAAAAAATAASAAPAPPPPASERAMGQLFRLDGRVALVTGASRGIGYAIACGLAEQGATVVLGGTTAASLASARETLLKDTSTPPERCSFVAFDVADEQSCLDAVATVARKHGHGPDILVNNAGINHRKPLEDFSTERFQHVLRTNLVGPFVLSRACAAEMRARGWGRIVNVGTAAQDSNAAAPPPRGTLLPANRPVRSALRLVACQARSWARSACHSCTHTSPLSTRCM